MTNQSFTGLSLQAALAILSLNSTDRRYVVLLRVYTTLQLINLYIPTEHQNYSRIKLEKKTGSAKFQAIQNNLQSKNSIYRRK